ncbi:isoaspartyl peptidase/L-asparaginase family protein [Legionella hackeliae]|uniref:Isoaspartyl peptidase n=1 Tax=Legionella hackeliae TaxID=449 RepID=A0A0A8UZ81_LEGHA|nr:isoaspartyl peptidase/L-asparaginase [Legionella hackeliae]KTD12643.1 isoaspartyl dipeptidase with L-asparaginase activity [Legionella hackeliae]CEK12059.1 Isoaspartyl peptidase/L-asparaginase [Legionella hackeliae]STX48847.1 isoaspartyl dipeptidase with L-asparaginase activity [Legionella hackeliae]
MSIVAIAVHGGAGEYSSFLKINRLQTEEGLAEAVQAGFAFLEDGGSALDAVEMAVRYLEDNPLFNAGKGSALNCAGEVEMDASIMDGENLKAGAVSMVREVRNPVMLARLIMDMTHHVYLSGYGALELAKIKNLHLEPESYFITKHQLEEFKKRNKNESFEQILNKKMMGTVGAVALDSQGNIAAATSTGGLSNCLPGRVGDSCLIGAGCYANNVSCAVSGTGEGEYLIRAVVANTIASLIEFKAMNLQEACDYVIHERTKQLKGEMGVIALNAKGEIATSFNTEIMKRAWRSSREKLQVKIE